MDNEIPGRVRELIARAETTHQAFAARIGLEPDKLSKALNGRRQFSTFELAAIADAARVSIDWILTGVTQSEPAIAARAQVDEAIDPALIERVARRFTDAHDQLALIDGSRELPALPAVAARRGSCVRGGEQLASWAHGQLAAKGACVVDLDQAGLLEAVELAFGVDAAVTDLPDGLDGYAWQSDGLRLLIVGRTEYWSRQRFSIAHELGHLVARDAQELIAEPVDSHRTDWTEKRANAFAAAFLMPEDFLRREAQEGLSQVAFDSLVSRMLVSPVSLGWRMLNLGLLTEQERLAWSGSTAEQCAMRAGRLDVVQLSRERSLAERLPPRLVQGHLRAFSDGCTSVRPLAQLLQMPVRDALATYGRP